MVMKMQVLYRVVLLGLLIAGCSQGFYTYEPEVKQYRINEWSVAASYRIDQSGVTDRALFNKDLTECTTEVINAYELNRIPWTFACTSAGIFEGKQPPANATPQDVRYCTDKMIDACMVKKGYNLNY